MERKGVSPDFARTIVRTNTTVIAALMVHLKEADAMIAGPTGRYSHHLESIKHLMGPDHPLGVIATLSALVLNQGLYFIADGYVNEDPNPEELARITQMAATHVKEFGVQPKIALLSHSSFGTSTSPSAVKLQKALEIIREQDPHLEIEGEMHGDAALNPYIRQHVFPNSLLEGEANLLIMPNIDAANISIALLRCLADGQPIGPILMGLSKSAHILAPSITVRGILNMTAFAVTDALRHEKLQEKKGMAHGD
jgi:malate dehydrogenase (oxaloacetate-decarboxylating)(NADP+)